MHSYALLAEVERSGFVGSRHFGSLVGLDAGGDVVLALGDVNAPVLPRSTSKPLQATGCLRVGAPLGGERLAIAAGSHTGEDRHVEVVLSGWSTDDYLDPGHPVQQAIRETMEQLADERVAHVAVDGCGAPTLALTLTGLARAMRRLGMAAGDTPEAAVAAAMRAHPEFVGGTGHINTELMLALPGIIAKGGAEGVLAVATADGHAVAMKIIDGSARACTPIALRALSLLGVDVGGARHFATVPVLGGGRPVGFIRASFSG